MTPQHGSRVELQRLLRALLQPAAEPDADTRAELSEIVETFYSAFQHPGSSITLMESIDPDYYRLDAPELRYLLISFLDLDQARSAHLLLKKLVTDRVTLARKHWRQYLEGANFRISAERLFDPPFDKTSGTFVKLEISWNPDNFSDVWFGHTFVSRTTKDDAVCHATLGLENAILESPGGTALAAHLRTMEVSDFKHDPAVSSKMLESNRTRCRKCHRTQTRAGKELSRCSGCNLARYCSESCQKSDWKYHKGWCAMERMQYIMLVSTSKQ